MPKKNFDVKPVDGTDQQIGLLLSMLDDGTREWRAEFGKVSEEAVIWQHFPNGHSIGTLILHIADAEAFWLYEVAGGYSRSQAEQERLLSDALDQYKIQWPKPPKRSLLWYFQQHDKIRARTRKTVLALNDPEHIGRYKEKKFTLRWMLHHVITHEAYHGGQAVLLALMKKSLSS